MRIQPVVSIFALLGLLVLGACGEPPSNDLPQMTVPAVPIGKVVGTFRNDDGIRAITIREVFSNDRWNGELSFSPRVGDWVRSVRCRVSGTDLVAELPTSHGMIFVKMFTLHGPETIIGLDPPWDGTYRRVD